MSRSEYLRCISAEAMAVLPATATVASISREDIACARYRICANGREYAVHHEDHADMLADRFRYALELLGAT